MSAPEVVQVILPPPTTVDLVVAGGLDQVSEWGLITGNLPDQTDLQTALDAKIDISRIVNDIDLLGGTVLTLSQTYHDTFNANRTITFFGTPVNGDIETRLRMYVISPMTLTFPISYRIGQLTNPITTLDFPPGYHEMSWSYAGGIFWLLDDADSGEGLASWGGITGDITDQTDLVSYVAAHGGSFLSNNTARVDLSGNDSTGAIGDLGKPFLTVQAAVTAFENKLAANPTDDPASYVVDVGNNYFSAAVTTSLPSITFVGIDYELANAFGTLTLTDNGGGRDFKMCRCNGTNVVVTSFSLTILLQDGGIGDITTSGGLKIGCDVMGFGEVTGNVTAGGAVQIMGLRYFGGIVSAPSFNIRISDSIPRYSNLDGSYGAGLASIDSTGSEVWATNSMLGDVTCATLHLIDARVQGTNNATSTVYADVLLLPRYQKSIDFDATAGLKLVNDSASPGNSKYYGTDSGGTKGYFSLSVQPADSDISFTDITTGNASTSSHGFAPKGTSGTTQYWRQDWTLATPAGSGTGTVTSIATTSPISGGTITTTGTISLLVNTDFLFTAAQTLTLAPAANTASTGWLLTDTTAASSGNQQYSPALRWTGQGWKTTATAASQAVDFRSYVVPVQGTANPTANLTFDSSINAGSFGNSIVFTSVGGIQARPGSGSNNTSGFLPGLSFIGDTGSGLYSRVSGTNLGISIGGFQYYDILTTIIRARKEGGFGWSSNSFDPTGNADTAIYRNAAGVVEVNNGTAGQWGAVKSGVRDGGTTTVTNGLTIGHQSTGTPAAGLGSAILFNINSSTTADQNAAQIYSSWTTATHGSRTSKVAIATVNNAGALTDSLTVNAGATATIGANANAGLGVPNIVKAGRVTAQSAANSNISQFTVGAADGSFEVSMNMNVTAATVLSTSLNCDYTDESNTARTMIFPTTSLSGTFLSGGLITATGAFETPAMHIRCKASTTITLYTAAGTFTSVTYTAEGIVKETV